MTMINLEELAKFLVKAKKGTYAGDGRELTPERPGFKELEFSDGDWVYRDSYVGFFRAPGQEVVRFQGEPVWTMSYDGGMLPGYREDVAFAKETFGFLKKALLLVPEYAPFRGPGKFEEHSGGIRWIYKTLLENILHSLTDFHGRETISIYDGTVTKNVFAQRYMGGLVIPK